LRISAGRCLDAMGRYSESQTQYETAVRLVPSSGPMHFLLGLSLGQQGKTTEAVEQFRESIRLMPDLIEAHLNLGRALSSQGQVKEALQEYLEVLRQCPTNALALRAVEQLRSRVPPSK
jgi:tetratricopeptide (TPR) repeat protein